MPINSGRKGIAASPAAPRGGFKARNFNGQGDASFGPPLGGYAARSRELEPDDEIVVPFRSRPFATTSTFIRGVTRDSTAAALPNCTVKLFRTSDDSLADQSVSDGSGNYSLRCLPGGGTFYVVAYLPGSPDVMGTGLKTLIGVYP